MRNYAGTCKGICSHNLIYNVLIQLLPLKSLVFVVHFLNAFWHGNEAFPKGSSQNEIVPLLVIFHLPYSKCRDVKICFHSCHYQNQNFSLVSHSCCLCSTRIALVSHLCHSCLTLVSLFCRDCLSKVDNILFTSKNLTLIITFFSTLLLRSVFNYFCCILFISISLKWDSRHRAFVGTKDPRLWI